MKLNHMDLLVRDVPATVAYFERYFGLEARTKRDSSALAVLTAWHGDPALIAAAALLGGGLGFATHATKLGLRYTIDASPEPITNGAANVAELGVVASIAYAIWHHPYVTLTIAIAVLVLLMLLVRTIWRAMRRALRGLKSPSASPG